MCYSWCYYILQYNSSNLHYCIFRKPWLSVVSGWRKQMLLSTTNLLGEIDGLWLVSYIFVSMIYLFLCPKIVLLDNIWNTHVWCRDTDVTEKIFKKCLQHAERAKGRNDLHSNRSKFAKMFCIHLCHKSKLEFR